MDIVNGFTVPLSEKHSHAPLPSPLPTPSTQQHQLYSCALLTILFVCPVSHNQLVVKHGHLLNQSQYGSTPFYYNREKRFHNCKKARERGGKGEKTKDPTQITDSRGAEGDRRE